MTIRSILIGLLGASSICAVTFFNDRILRGTYLIGNNLPIVVYGLLIIFVVFLNPFIKRLALTGKELAVILAMTLAACTIPSSGLLRTFPGVCVLPLHLERTQPAWHGEQPTLEAMQIKNWEALISGLKSDREAPRKIYALLPTDLQEELNAVNTVPSGKLQDRLIEALNGLMVDRRMLEQGIHKLCPLPQYVEGYKDKDPAKLTNRYAELLGRATLEGAFPDAIIPREVSIIEQVPPHLLVDSSENERQVVDGFLMGRPNPAKHITFGEIPWKAWTKTLLFWTPIILTLWAATLALSVVVHRQWSKHEHLPYPIATFANSLLPEEGSTKAAIFRHKGFWVAAGVVLGIYLINYLHQWFPLYVPAIPRRLDLRAIAGLFPTFNNVGGGWLMWPTVYFIAIGIAYFIPQEISLAFGFGPFLWVIIVAILATHGINPNSAMEGTNWWMGISPKAFLTFGSCFGVFLSILYTGRNYYKAVFSRSVGLKTGESLENHEVWAGRAFALFAFLFISQLAILARVGFAMAILYAAIIFIMAIVTARVIAETGLFHIQIMVFPCVILWGIIGVQGINPNVLLVLQIVSMVLLIDPRESLMPFMVNSLKVLEHRSVKLGRATICTAAAIVLGLAVGLPVTMYMQYDNGATGDRWAEDTVPKMPFDNAVAAQNRLKARGVFDAAGSGPRTDAVQPGFASKISPNSICVWSLLIGMGLSIGAMVARLRWRWWPIHPLLFVLWATGHIRHFAGAFIIGWLIKVLVTRYGGNRVYEQLKPVMIGLIAGEVFGAVVPCIVGGICWLITGEMPTPFRILPG